MHLSAVNGLPHAVGLRAVIGRSSFTVGLGSSVSTPLPSSRTRGRARSEPGQGARPGTNSSLNVPLDHQLRDAVARDGTPAVCSGIEVDQRAPSSSPRYPASTVPGAFSTVTPCLAASPEPRMHQRHVARRAGRSPRRSAPGPARNGFSVTSTAATRSAPASPGVGVPQLGRMSPGSSALDQDLGGFGLVVWLVERHQAAHSSHTGWPSSVPCSRAGCDA